jgi:hypothetical protein
MTTPPRSSVWRRPGTKLGTWAVRLAGIFLGLFLINSLVFIPISQNPSNEGWMHTYLPFYGIFMLLCGLAAGIVGFMAVIRDRERSWLVWLTILPLVFVLFLLLGELLVPH